jgi:hypothetical protein
MRLCPLLCRHAACSTAQRRRPATAPCLRTAAARQLVRPCLLTPLPRSVAQAFGRACPLRFVRPFGPPLGRNPPSEGWDQPLILFSDGRMGEARGAVALERRRRLCLRWWGAERKRGGSLKPAARYGGRASGRTAVPSRLASVGS